MSVNWRACTICIRLILKCLVTNYIHMSILIKWNNFVNNNNKCEQYFPNHKLSATKYFKQEIFSSQITLHIVFVSNSFLLFMKRPYVHYIFTVNGLLTVYCSFCTDEWPQFYIQRRKLQKT